MKLKLEFGCKLYVLLKLATIKNSIFFLDIVLYVYSIQLVGLALIKNPISVRNGCGGRVYEPSLIQDRNMLKSNCFKFREL